MADLPLKGIRVIDLTVVLAGPYAAMFLADFGAEVIRVESIQHFPPGTRGQFARPAAGDVYPNKDPGKRPWNRYPMFNTMARNKRSMTVDFTRPEGMEIFKRLVRVSDVVIENYVPEVMDKLGITYEMLKSEKPDIIFAKMSGYGDTGDYRDYRAMAMSVDHPIGHAALRWYRDLDPTNMDSCAFEDPMMGVTGVFAIVSALHHRNRTGKGQALDMCLAEVGMTSLPLAYMDYSMNGRVHDKLGNRDPVAAPCGVFRCLGQDKWVSISIFNDEEWEAFGRIVGEEWVQDPRFNNVLSRQKNQDELEPLVEAWTSRHGDYEVMYLLQNVGIAAGPVLDDEAACNDPHLNARGFFVEESQEDVGTHLYPGFITRMSKTPCQVWRGPVRLGEDNEYVYKKVLGISNAEYETLVETGHIGTEYAPGVR